MTVEISVVLCISDVVTPGKSASEIGPLEVPDEKEIGDVDEADGCVTGERVVTGVAIVSREDVLVVVVGNFVEL